MPEYHNHVPAISVACGFLGCLLIAWSVFLYEGEERRVGDVLVAWWIKLDDVGQQSVSRNVAFVRQMSQTITAWLDTTFGQRLVSLRALSTSFCLSLSSMFMLLFAMNLHDQSARWREAVIAGLGPAAVLFMFAVTERRLAQSMKMSLFVLFWFLVALVIGDCTFRQQDAKALLATLGFALVFAVGTVADFAVITVTRRLAARGTAVRSLAWPTLV